MLNENLKTSILDVIRVSEYTPPEEIDSRIERLKSEFIAIDKFRTFLNIEIDRIARTAISQIFRKGMMNFNNYAELLIVEIQDEVKGSEFIENNVETIVCMYRNSIHDFVKTNFIGIDNVGQMLDPLAALAEIIVCKLTFLKLKENNLTFCSTKEQFVAAAEAYSNK